MLGSHSFHYISRKSRLAYSVYAFGWVSLRFLCSFTFCMMLMVKKGTRNIAKKTRVRITIDTSIVVKVNLLVIKGYSTALLKDHFIV